MIQIPLVVIFFSFISLDKSNSEVELTPVDENKTLENIAGFLEGRVLVSLLLVVLSSNTITRQIAAYRCTVLS